MTATEREAWYIKHTALVQYDKTKTTIWTVEGGMTSGETADAAIAAMEDALGRGRETLPLAEAEQRMTVAVDALEASINRVDKTTGKRDEERRASLRVAIMNLLREQYTITEDT